MNWHRNVEVVPAAAGRTSGEISFARHPSYRMLSVAGSDEHDKRGVKDGFETITVPVVRINDLIPAGCPIRMVKIDVEGGEADVIEGMLGLIDSRRIDYVVAEVIRDNAASRWANTVRHLQHCVQHHGARLWKLDHRGGRIATSLEEVTLRESISQLVIDFT